MAKKKSSKKSSKDDQDVCCDYALQDEHRVFSHIMYILFLVTIAVAAYYTFNMFAYNTSPDFMPVKALVLLGWAWFFKTFAHRVHHPHH